MQKTTQHKCRNEVVTISWWCVPSANQNVKGNLKSSTELYSLAHSQKTQNIITFESVGQLKYKDIKIRHSQDKLRNYLGKSTYLCPFIDI